MCNKESSYGEKKKAFLLTLCTLFVCLGFGIISLAESKSITKAYGDFYLNCYISCEATCGIGSTSGIASPYKNYVAVTIYNINQKPIASNYKDAYSKSTVTMNHIGIYGTATIHAGKDIDGEYLVPITQAIKQHQYR